ncbi:GyrI-like domain-containing protein [Cellulomonas sp. ATA003]|uniref:GyrI-like domain-containing protein n=1 Tax=Cellulomonas sp. ATA003 TaxID=3073064 RepID=UPI0028737A97|nr:GyrI-like domain-containing protein [Cellulomonas sp. ATA003]WNB86274.1 GyrI-like domain-containing protein [Cellulomonas sp. ATA003]
MRTDVRKDMDCYAARRGQIRLVEVPPLQYVMVDGHGDPNTTPAYAEALGVLYPIAYTLKFASRDLGRDYVVPPLEALWSAQDMAAFTTRRDKSAWDWTLMLLAPDWLGAEHVAAARAGVAARHPHLALDRVRLDTLDEGLCVQTLHVGPFDDEGPVLADLHDRFLPAHGLEPTARHHEVYLTDPRRTAPERLRTILRQPVRRTDPPGPTGAGGPDRDERD